jgi:hypothetical protein
LAASRASKPALVKSWVSYSQFRTTARPAASSASYSAFVTIFGAVLELTYDRYRDTPDAPAAFSAAVDGHGLNA